MMFDLTIFEQIGLAITAISSVGLLVDFACVGIDWEHYRRRKA